MTNPPWIEFLIVPTLVFIGTIQRSSVQERTKTNAKLNWIDPLMINFQHKPISFHARKSQTNVSFTWPISTRVQLSQWKLCTKPSARAVLDMTAFVRLTFWIARFLTTGMSHDWARYGNRFGKTFYSLVKPWNWEVYIIPTNISKDFCFTFFQFFFC